MTDSELDALLASLPPRSLESTVFNLANAYNEAAHATLAMLPKTGNADLAGPAIMCLSFSLELLLKFLRIVEADPTGSATYEQLHARGVNLRGHGYSTHFEELSDTMRARLADRYGRVVGRTVSVEEYRAALLSQGEEPFVQWRYVYEDRTMRHLELQQFLAVVKATGLAAQDERRRMAGARTRIMEYKLHSTE